MIDFVLENMNEALPGVYVTEHERTGLITACGTMGGIEWLRGRRWPAGRSPWREITLPGVDASFLHGCELGLLQRDGLSSRRGSLRLVVVWK